MQKSESAQEDFLGNLFLVGKTDGGNRLVTNLKKLYTFIPYEYFEKKCLHGLNFLLEKKRFPVQDRSQRLSLRNPSQQTIIEICEIQVVRQPLRVSLPLFRVSSKSFH